MHKQKTALISVYNKKDIEKFAKSLIDLGWRIISSGGTAKHLKDAGVVVTDVEEITGMPAILSHRVVTLHPKVHGGLLALDIPEHLAELKKYQIPWINLVCVDLYPLEEEIAKKASTKESVIEKTDMGGVALLRSSAKGRRITICDPADRARVIEWLKNGELDKDNFISTLASKAEFLVTEYCLISARYISEQDYDGLLGQRLLICKYGENGYQTPAIFYQSSNKNDVLVLSEFIPILGTALSYNNWCDIDRMLQTVTHIAAGFDLNFKKVPKIAIGVKHGNSCGAAVTESPEDAIKKMLEGDLRAIFGGLIMVNFEINEELAEIILTHRMAMGRRLLDGIVAPHFTEGAVNMLKRKGDKCRLIVNTYLNNLDQHSLDAHKRFRYVRGGFLAQPNYTFLPNLSKMHFDIRVLQDIVLAWAVGCTSNSNTIAIVKDGRLYGNGVGQQDRVGAAKLAIFRADEAAAFSAVAEKAAARSQANLENAVAYSDSFFPFTDALEVLINRGIKTIFSTSGSINDQKIMELCKAKGVNLIMLPDTEARGFYQH